MPCSLAPLDDLESGALEHSERALVGLRGWNPLAVGLDRVGLDERRAVLTRVVDGRVEQRAGDPLATGVARATTKQTIDQTGLASTGARAFECWRRS